MLTILQEPRGCGRFTSGGLAQNPYDIHLVPVGGVVSGSGVINGSVTIGEGKSDPGTNIIIMLMDENENIIAFAESNDEGLFGFENLAFGTYKLKVEIPRKSSAIATVVLGEDYPQGEVNFIVKDAEVTLASGEVNTFAAYVGEIFPKPVTAETNLEINLIQPSFLTLRIMNQLGQVVYSKKLSLNESNQMINIETSDLMHGFFTLLITNDEGGMLVKKFIK